jgi:Acyl CoA:acetate/3-ketoacid CoA transferase, alpha subunit
MSLKEAISTFVSDGCSITFGGMGGAQSIAETHEIIRQKKKNLTMICDSPCEPADMLLGAGTYKRLEIAYVAHVLPGPGYNFRRAFEQKVPFAIEIEEWTNSTIGMRFLAGAMGLPYMPTKSLLGSDYTQINSRIITTTDPYKQEPIALVPAANPDVAIVHVSRCDIKGNSQIFGFSSNIENMARAAKHTIVTCEEIVSSDVIRRYGNLTIIPGYTVDAVVELPFASHPWNMGYAYAYDFVFAKDYVKQTATREGFLEWLDEWVYSLPDHEAYCSKVGWGRLQKLEQMERKFTHAPY